MTGDANSRSVSASRAGILLRSCLLFAISSVTTFASSELSHSSFQLSRLPSSRLPPLAAVSRINSATFFAGGQCTPRSAKYLVTALPFSPTGPK